ncbi:MAG: secondary thiamine-phosphate synthase enzyme YjbQ [Christensenellaceae bacterium]
MKVVHELIKLSSHGNQPTFHCITKEVGDTVLHSDVKNGICVVFSRHTTCSIITDECALDKSVTGLETLQQDMVDVLERLIPTCRREKMYLHPGPKALKFAAEHGEDARGCHNTEAHLRSSIIGRCETIPIVDGKLDLGDFGNVYMIDFDQTRPRSRSVSVQIMGE